MSKKRKIRGFEKVNANLNKALTKIKGNIIPGMIELSILIRRDIDLVSPVVPVDTGNLRGSWFTVASNGKEITGLHTDQKIVSKYKGKVSSSSKPMLAMGLSANYAGAVHERMDMEFKRPGAGPKFLEAALKRNKKKALEIIRDKAKV